MQDWGVFWGDSFGSSWGPTVPPYSGAHSSVGGIPGLTAALLATVNAATIPLNIKKVNAVSVAGTGVPETDPWRPA